MNNDDRIRIGVAGHVNVGKTTLISTLTRSYAGKIGDKANVTIQGDNFQHNSLFATFVDVPGFQNALLINYFFNSENPSLNYVEDKLSKDVKFQYDLKAIQALKNNDLILYVVSLTDIPKQFYEEEISLIKRLNPNVVAVLNQYIREYRSSGERGVEDRVKQWEQLFTQFQCKSILLDAHWDSPVKVNKLYALIKDTLNIERKQIFSQGLEKFKINQNVIKIQACEQLYKAIKEIYDSCLKPRTVERKNYYNSVYRNKIKEELKTTIDRILRYFVADVLAIYSIGSESPTYSIDDLKYNLNNVIVNSRKRDEFVREYSKGSGVVFAVLGGFIGLIVDSATGGTTGGMGAKLGASLGSGLGRSIAEAEALEKYDGKEDTIVFTIDKTIISPIVILGLAIIWGVSQVGYGSNWGVEQINSNSKRELSKHEIDYLVGLIQKENKDSFENLNWESSNSTYKSAIIEKFEYLLNRLEIKDKIYIPDLNWVK